MKKEEEELLGQLEQEQTETVMRKNKIQRRECYQEEFPLQDHPATTSLM